MTNTKQASSTSAAIEWFEVADVLPDDETTVMIVLDGEEVWIGWRSEDLWYDVSARPAGERVTHWAHLPAAPLRSAA
ncbi:DUF551 domain-containing protein [Massilia yuzhufengensis]|uniref:DUF551 domain-containing protein n=1 Tax=Massilia yuzhufengensis TaxID=1164594 RepID=A0A1I1VMI3_9BURK|nr:DUF551 domain-containing protein [Massilia yuzhufengensis]SFD84227.1 Protein of unknown function [Massilia yuzhufengensis]